MVSLLRLTQLSVLSPAITMENMITWKSSQLSQQFLAQALIHPSKAILVKYKQIVVSNYKEPRMDGNFDDCTKEMLKELEDDDSDTDEEVQSNTDSEIWLLNCFFIFSSSSLFSSHIILSHYSLHTLYVGVFLH